MFSLLKAGVIITVLCIQLAEAKPKEDGNPKKFINAKQTLEVVLEEVQELQQSNDGAQDSDQPQVMEEIPSNNTIKRIMTPFNGKTRNIPRMASSGTSDGPFDKVWSVGQCPTLGTQTGLSLSGCKALCILTTDCSAFNYADQDPSSGLSNCVLKNCGERVPEPEDNVNHYEGYSLYKVCPAGWEVLGHRCYWFSRRTNHKKTWPQAQAYCQLNGGYLATMGFEGASDEDPVLQFIFKKGWGHDSHIGIEMNSDKIYSWVDGRPLSRNSHLWHYDFPQDRGCGILYHWPNNNKKRTYIGDYNCGDSRYFICELNN